MSAPAPPGGGHGRENSIFDDARAALEVLRVTDWAATALGPMEHWPEELRSAVRTVLPSRMPMLLWWGPDLIQIYNEACVLLLGDKHPGAAGQPAAECWSEAWDEIGPLANAVLTGRGATYSENLFLLLDRHGYLEETYWTFSYSPVLDEAGRVRGLFVAMTDTTARVIGERRLRTLHELGGISAAQARTAFDACRHAVEVLGHNRADVPFAMAYLLDPHGRLLELCNSSGLTPETQGAWTSIPGPDDKSALWAVLAARRSERVLDFRSRYEATFVPVSPPTASPEAAMVLPLVEAGRESAVGVLVLGVSPYRALEDDYAFFFDLVARQVSTALIDVLAYEAERRRAEALSELDRAKTRFLQNVSHEFRTPLTLLLGPLEALLADPALALPTVHDEGMRAAERAARRLRRLVDTLLQVALADAKQLELRPEPTDAGTLTAEYTSMFAAAVEAAGLALVVDTPAEAVLVALDRELWAKVVLNLVSNAFKFTSTGSITVRLRVTDQLVLTVTDTGHGIPAEELPRVFDRFHQLADHPGRSREGIGIGLSLVADLVRAAHGDIRVESTVDQGTTFTVTLPVGPSPDGPARPFEGPPGGLADAFVAEAQPWVAPLPVGGAQPGEGADRRLLLVEDNADMRAYLTRILEDDGWVVDAAGDLSGALARTIAPDLVLSDVMLPGRDGLELVRLMRSDPAFAHIPIVLLTARAGPESAAEGLDAGADDYVVKPFDAAELKARLRVRAELSRLRRSAIERAEERAANLEVALASNREIGAAIGILMHQQRITEARAFELLRQASQDLNRKMRDVAEDVRLTGRLPETGGG